MGNYHTYLVFTSKLAKAVDAHTRERPRQGVDVAGRALDLLSFCRISYRAQPAKPDRQQAVLWASSTCDHHDCRRGPFLLVVYIGVGPASTRQMLRRGASRSPFNFPDGELGFATAIECKLYLWSRKDDSSKGGPTRPLARSRAGPAQQRASLHRAALTGGTHLSVTHRTVRLPPHASVAAVARFTRPAPRPRALAPGIATPAKPPRKPLEALAATHPRRGTRARSRQRHGGVTRFPPLPLAHAYKKLPTPQLEPNCSLGVYPLSATTENAKQRRRRGREEEEGSRRKERGGEGPPRRGNPGAELNRTSTTPSPGTASPRHCANVTLPCLFLLEPVGEPNSVETRLDSSPMRSPEFMPSRSAAARRTSSTLAHAHTRASSRGTGLPDNRGLLGLAAAMARERTHPRPHEHMHTHTRTARAQARSRAAPATRHCLARPASLPRPPRALPPRRTALVPRLASLPSLEHCTANAHARRAVASRASRTPVRRFVEHVARRAAAPDPVDAVQVSRTHGSRWTAPTRAVAPCRVADRRGPLPRGPTCQVDSVVMTSAGPTLTSSLPDPSADQGRVARSGAATCRQLIEDPAEDFDNYPHSPGSRPSNLLNAH
ncbi:hypothetical protein HU200_027965 [Digitaria exilis]|uniref:Uncharacterized protein n=1 Tax=Digitaria exilis TaxID=1010633 RepID=A0A835BW98_9POAL|nr:hypothetical protein HU200_027965 [Digitaria exilis]